MTETAKAVWAGLGAVAVIVAAVVGSVVLTKLAWNHGVAPAAHIGGIGFWNSFWINVALSTIRADGARSLQASKIAKAIESLKRK